MRDQPPFAVLSQQHQLPRRRFRSSAATSNDNCFSMPSHAKPTFGQHCDAIGSVSLVWPLLASHDRFATQWLDLQDHASVVNIITPCRLHQAETRAAR